MRIVQLPLAAHQALAAGDLAAAQESSPVALTDWLAGPECVSVWRIRAAQLPQHPEDADWVTGALVDAETDQVVGRAGFHAAPDPAGMVEVGYGVDPAFRRRGFARAALASLIERARRDPAVRRVRASVSPDNDASLALIREFGFFPIGEQWDDEDGLELILEIDVAGDGS
ncbi:hypothetical protein GCM10027026_10250 [Myroides odoratimimus subsp. xuanwuensis]